MSNLFKGLTKLLTSLYMYTKYSINKQIIIIKNKYHSLPHKIKESFYFFIKGINVYRRTVLVINILA